MKVKSGESANRKNIENSYSQRYREQEFNVRKRQENSIFEICFSNFLSSLQFHIFLLLHCLSDYVTL